MKTQILITERFDFETLAQLRALPHFDVLTGSVENYSPEQLAHIQGLVVRSKTLITKDLLKKLKSLKVIITCTSGFDHIDLSACLESTVTVMHTPEAHASSAAELTWALLLATLKKIPLAHQQVLMGNWDRALVTGTELSGLRLGIVGLGRIGQKVARIANAFDMNVCAFDPYQDDPVFKACQAQRVSYQELLLSADIISFHVPKSLETTHMLRGSNVEDVSRGIVLINASRGDVIDPKFIQDGLRLGYIKALGLDVYHKEPLPLDTPYLKDPRCVLSPHIGANTDQALKKASTEALKKLVAYFTQNLTSDTLPPQALWFTSPMGLKDS